MKAKDDLFVLIKSLTQTEKAYFKKYASIHSDSDKVYMILFDLINELEEYDEALLKKKIKHDGLHKHFAVYKNYLYKILLKSLAQYIKNHTPNFGLEEILLEIEILLSKNLFDQCTALISKAKVIAKANENFPALLKVIHLEIRYIKQSPKVKNWSEMYAEAVQEEKEALQKLFDISLTRNLNAEMFLFLQRHYQEEKTEKVEAEKLQLFNRLQAIKACTSAECEINHLSAWVNYYKFTEEPKKALPYQLKAIRIFQEKPFLIQNEALRYINSLSNLLILQEQLDDDVAFGEALIALNKVPDILPKNLLSPNLQLHVFALALRHQLKFLVNRERFHEALTLCISAKNRLLNHTNIINEVLLYQIYFYNARVFFEFTKTSETVFWIQKILQTAQNKYNKRFHFFAKMIHFLVYWEDEDLAFVDSLAQSLLSFIKYQNIQSESEKLIIRRLVSFRKKANQKTPPDKHDFLTSLKAELLSLNAPVLENYFDYPRWVKLALENL